MFVINDDMSISVTRGDVLFFSVSAEYKDGTPFQFKAGDILRMRVFERKGCDNVVLLKNFVITEAGESFDIFLSGSDTKIGEIISKPVNYWYEIELNPDTNPQTIIGYDDDGGAKVFRLLPEGKDITDGELDEATKSDVQKIIEETAKEYFEDAMLPGSIEEEVNRYMEKNPVEDGLTPYIGANGNWWIGVKDTGVPATGADGISPLLRINEDTTEWEVSHDGGISYENTGVVAKGENGKNGVTFTPSVNESGDLSWTNDGGLANPAAVNIHGRDGEDGYTPVKGTDYYTEEEKEELVEEIAENSFGIKTASIDFSNWGNGSFVETLSDGTTVTHTITSDTNGVITQIDDMTVSGVNA